MIPPPIPRPGTAVGQEHHGQGPVGDSVPVPVARRGKGVIADEVEPVAGLDDRGPHAGQGRVFERLPVGEQKAGLFCAAVIIVVADRPRVHQEGDDPGHEIPRGAGHLDLAVGHGGERRQVLRHGRIERGPAFPLVRERRGRNAHVDGIDDESGNVRFRIGGEHRRPARGVIDGRQGGGVAAPAVGHVERAAVPVKTDVPGVAVVLERDRILFEKSPVVVRIKNIDAPVRIHLRRFAQPQIAVEGKAGEPVVLQHGRQDAGHEVEPVDVVPLRIAVVDPHHDVLGERVA